ncbi:D5-like helicase-primase [Rhizophagus irregularis DAOM 181602=DAOM 197198]|nr:D5-like helicase-primase [Rhizophagus irregularis DAOM 181602=DAOM 197198]
MAAQVPAIFNPNNRFFYDDLLKKCIGTHTKESINSAISASVAFITTKSGMWIRKKKAYNGSIYFEFAADLKGISTKHKVSIRSDAGEDDGMTTSIKLKDLLIQASVTKICYTDVNFMPYPPNAPKYNPEFFNLFLGFRAQPAEHIKPNLVNPIIRHVHESPRCGKNILTDFIGERILGRENFLSTTRLEDVMGRFNAAVRAKKLIILNECDMSGKEWHGANNRLKSLITEPYISIEEKGIDVKVIDDFAGYMILSNHAMPIRIEMGDERFVALNVSAKYKGNREYFGSLVKVLENPDTASSFMSYLLSRDLTSFNPRSIPDTQMKQELIEASIPNPQRFIQYYLEMMWPDNCDTLEIPCTNFYSTYQNWCSEKGENKTLSDNKFGMEIKQFIPKTRPRRSGARINYYILDKAKIAKNFSRVIQETQDIQEAQVDQEEVEPVVEKPAEEKPASVEKKPTEETKKTPPPVPLKPDCLKVKPAPVINEDPIPEESPAPIESDTDEPIDSFSDYDLLSDSDFTTVNPAPEQQPESPAEFSASVTKPDPEPAPEEQPESPAEFSASVTKPDPEPAPKEQPIPEPDTELEVDWDPEPKEGTRAHWAWHERHRWDRKPWVKNSKDQVFNDLHNTGKIYG